MRIQRQGPVEGKNTFTILSLSKKKRKTEIKRKESVVDDWETAELMEEERERKGSGGNLEIGGSAEKEKPGSDGENASGEERADYKGSEVVTDQDRSVSFSDPGGRAMGTWAEMDDEDE